MLCEECVEVELFIFAEFKGGRMKRQMMLQSELTRGPLISLPPPFKLLEVGFSPPITASFL